MADKNARSTCQSLMAYTSYNKIGINYDATRCADPHLSERLIALLNSPTNGHVLDVGCGTGNYTMALAKRDLQLTGIDPSEQMLEVAKTKSSNIQWHQGTAELLPFPDAHFDGASAVLTTHHWDDVEKGFKEISRVLKPGAKVVLLTSTPEQTGQYWLQHYFPKMIAASCTALPTFETTSIALKNAGFDQVTTEKYDVKHDLQDLFLYSGKHEPQHYLDPEFRRGSSSFAALANKEEVETGLQRMEADILSGEWKKVQAKYVHDKGDYLFVVADRS